jgi:hypothetical protein
MLLRDAQPAPAGARGSGAPPAPLAGKVPQAVRSPWRGPDAAWRAGWAALSVALAVVALWLVYVIAANVILLGGMPKR